MKLTLHFGDQTIPVPLDPDLLFLAEQAQQSNIVQDLYRIQMERNESRVPVFVDAYDPNQARDPGGKWTGGSGGSKSSKPTRGISHPGDSPEEAKRFATERLKRDGSAEGMSSVRCVKGPTSGLWGASHYGSSVITGHSAKIMGIGGYKYTEPTKQAASLGDKFLDIIAEGHEAGEKIYHGFDDTQKIDWKEGDTIKLPLTATTGDIDYAAGYGVSYSREDNSGATMFEMPARTPVAGYQRWDRESTEEFGHTWGEAITAGEFKVVGFSTHTDQGWKQLPVKIVRLEPVSLFDRASGKWRKI